MTGVSPNAGSTTGGTSVTITGTNFTGATLVEFGTIGANFTVNSATSITATTGQHAAGTFDVLVTNASGQSVATSADQFTFSAPPPAPVVSTVNPNSGPTAGGTSVVIGGSHLTGATSVKFGSVAATALVVNSDNQVTATAPAGSGTVDITVVTAGGTSATSSSDHFTYNNGMPTLTGLSPASGPAAGGASVTITGTNFSGVTQVSFGTFAVSFNVVNSTTINATTPEGAGTVDVTVTTGAGTTAITAADQYTYTGAPPAPSVTSVFPNFGAVAGGTVITLGGGNFVGVTAVKFGGVNATSFALQPGSTGNMSAVAPAGVAGPVDVTVTNAGGTSTISSADVYTYSGSATAPAMGSITPTSGPAAGGTVVTLTGAGFSGATAVKFGAQAATNVQVRNDEVIVATSPAGSGVVDISVTTPLGTSEATSGDQFTYSGTSAQPQVTQVNPNSGPPAGGTTVTITGVYFTGETGVKFGATSATFQGQQHDGDRFATVPAGSGTIDITVTTASRNQCDGHGGPLHLPTSRDRARRRSPRSVPRAAQRRAGRR